MPIPLFKFVYKLFYGNRSKEAWKDFEYFDSKWKKRISRMAKMIDQEKSFLDLGCGKMWLKAFLSPQCNYNGCDYKRRDEETLVCDFNKKEFPKLLVDCCFASGVIEYLDDPTWFFIQTSKTAKALIFSYCPAEIQPDISFRQSLGWRNNLSREEICTLAEKAGYKKQIDVKDFDGCDLYKFSHP